MFWEESESQKSELSSHVIASFQVQISVLRVDHMEALSNSIISKVPYLRGYDGVGLHEIHGAESGNGWQRDECNDAVFYPSKRSRLLLQLPFEIAEQVMADLADFEGKLWGESLRLSKPKILAIQKCQTIFARHIENSQINELDFLRDVKSQLQARQITVKKMICGKSRVIKRSVGDLHTRSLMLADLNILDAIRLLSVGIGSYKLLGCGLFLPHKTIKSICD